MSNVLNYDPADPDKMRLPAGKSCGGCANHPCCKRLFGCPAENTGCDFAPSRFVEAKP